MCPIYKKGIHTDFKNYRPITVLNTNYKIMIKLLSMRIGEVAHDIIYEDQAGFMTGKCIEDQTELAHFMTRQYKEKEENEMIVCLDQKKAYDKILHTFLWASLSKFHFPVSFIKTIQKLYKDAHMSVLLNGEMNTLQGDQVA